jgi:hypothetical protein
MRKKYVIITIGVLVVILGIAMFLFGVSMFTYQGPPISNWVNNAGKYSFILFLPTISVGITLLISGVRIKKAAALALLLFTCTLLKAQEHSMSKTYVTPTDTLVQQKLHKWQDLKFGLFMHWGPYSEWGVVESWSLCPEDEGWTQRYL